MKTYKGILFVLLAMVTVLTSCDTRKSRSTELKELEKMEARLDSVHAIVPGLAVEDILNKTRIIKADLRLAQDSAKRSITLDEGIELDRYKDIYKLFKSYPVGNLSKDYFNHKKQLNDFVGLIKSEATMDKNGKEITESYIDENFQAEMRYCTDYVNKVLEIEKRVVKFRDRYSETKPMIDSLITEITREQ